jgi:Zn finger protein HypA/HybF involved in hydrogenase expression
MELFEKIGSKISSGSKDVAKKAKDMTELAKLNSRIHGYEDMIKEAQLQIGKMYFEAYRDNPAPEFMELFQHVINAQAAMEKCREEICAIKGVRACVNCGAEIPNNSTFCPACGTKNEILDVPYTAAAAELYCPGCGAGLAADTVFCPNCGTKVN